MITPRQLERAERIGAIFALICIGAVIAGLQCNPTGLQDNRCSLSVFVPGWLLMLFLLYRSPTESSN
jgi:hypothetical protein